MFHLAAILEKRLSIPIEYEGNEDDSFLCTWHDFSAAKVRACVSKINSPSKHENSDRIARVLCERG